jgi:tetratricopeptide (TPR) repeat protein
VLIVRIRHAETALEAGRLDEAYDLAQAADLRSHRRGQDLVSRLVLAFVQRGQEHLAGERWQQALGDAQRAFKLGGNRPEVSQLQAAVAEALGNRQQSQHRRADVVLEAGRHLRDGHLTLAEGLLGEAGYDGNQSAALRREVAARRAGVEPALNLAQVALDRQDWDAAIRAILDARRLHASNAQVTEVAAKIAQAVLRETRESIDAGRIDRAQALIDRLLPLAGRTVDLLEVDRIVGQCEVAAESIARGQPQDAERVLRQLAPVLPQAGWLQDAITAARQAAEGIEHLRVGPLGLIMAQAPRWPERSQPLQSDQDLETTRRIEVAGAAQPAGQGGTDRFLLQVDGIGSYLVVRKGVVTIGAAGSSSGCDIPLMTEPGLAGVTIERSEEDYFLRSPQAVLVNDKPVTQRLLVDGDRIALSSRCRMRFGLPNAASTSAVLHLSGTRLPKTDARRVILLDRELVIGPGSASHVRADSLAEPVVLYVRDGRLCCRTKEPVQVNDAVQDGSAGLPLGSNVRIGPVSMVMTTVASC